MDLHVYCSFKAILTGKWRMRSAVSGKSEARASGQRVAGAKHGPVAGKCKVRSAVSGKSEAPATRSWVSWVSWVSWQGASHAQRASRLPSDLPPARMPLASGRTARKGFHWKAGGQDIPGPPGHPGRGRAAGGGARSTGRRLEGGCPSQTCFALRSASCLSSSSVGVLRK